jgi:hypothetical protein
MFKTIVVMGMVLVGRPLVTGEPPQLTDRERARQIAQLGPEPTYFVPQTLADLVSVAQAAVVARIESAGEIVWIEDVTPGGTYVGSDAFATYNVVIEEVLFNTHKEAAPALLAGNSVLTQRLGREAAGEFIANRQPVRTNDRCLLFLWYRPGTADWSILQWPLQFRQSTGVEGGAEPVSPLPAGLSLLRQDWFGALVAVTKSTQGAVPQWRALVQEVRRLSAVER